jgi:hypothetical protein
MLCYPIRLRLLLQSALCQQEGRKFVDRPARPRRLKEIAMANVYVSRDGLGRIDGVYHNRQPGFATEVLDEDAAEVQAFLHSADLSIYRRAGTARRARQFAEALEKDPLAALVERAKEES